MVAGHDVAAQHQPRVQHPEDVQREDRDFLSRRVFSRLHPDGHRQDRAQDAAGVRQAADLQQVRFYEFFVPCQYPKLMCKVTI